MNIPLATYRLQLNKGFGFTEVKNIISYLKLLGVSHIYASPITQARQGSAHGYDVVNPTTINAELGSLALLKQIVTQLHTEHMGWIQDIVPNHMAFDSDNIFLMDIFESGHDSAYFNFFDIDWDHAYENLKGRVLVPVLGKFYAECLENGKLSLVFDESGFAIQYYALRLPIRIQSYIEILGHNCHECERTLRDDNNTLMNYLGVVQLFKNIGGEEEIALRADHIRHAKAMLWDVYSSNVLVREWLEGILKTFNGTVGTPESFNELDALISEQYYRLSFWKVASEEINYRRFFTVNDLISVRVEDPKVFDETHQLIASLIGENLIDGVRVDHVDGLLDPEEYLKRLRTVLGDAYIIVEKILEYGERVPHSWPIQGTTGYEALAVINGLFCDASQEHKFNKLYFQLTGLFIAFEDLVASKKRLIIGKHMAGNVDNLAQYIKQISVTDRSGRDITLYGLKRALVEVLTYFPVYRTYINATNRTDNDNEYISVAIQKAKEKNPFLEYELAFIEKFLMMKCDPSLPEDKKREWLHVIMNFQQQTSPLMAKGFEDTIFYVFNRLISLNEVGSNPKYFGIGTDIMHAFNICRAQHQPHSMTATATHDTKRGEDTRARINVLSELVDEFKLNIKKWRMVNRGKKRKINNVYYPDANDEYFLYQTLLGTYPLHGSHGQEYIQRIKEYSVKAIREAKVHTAWIKPDEEYETVFQYFIERILQQTERNRFLKEFIPFQTKVAAYGMLNSLSQVMLKMTMPGVPDCYQGTELWDLSLVDPDNRRPVDYDYRNDKLRYIMECVPKDILALIEELWQTRTDGSIKMFLLHRLLYARKTHNDLFLNGTYVPLQCDGLHSECVIAFARKSNERSIITIVPRYFTRIYSEAEKPFGGSQWEDTRLFIPEEYQGEYTDIISSQQVIIGSEVALNAACRYFPGAVYITQT